MTQRSQRKNVLFQRYISCVPRLNLSFYENINSLTTGKRGGIYESNCFRSGPGRLSRVVLRRMQTVFGHKRPGCRENQKASWCKVRSCGIRHEYASCADCETFSDPNACKHFNNFISKMFALVFRSDRVACIRQIRDLGIQGYADKMSSLGLQSIRRQ